MKSVNIERKVLVETATEFFTGSHLSSPEKMAAVAELFMEVTGNAAEDVASWEGDEGTKSSTLKVIASIREKVFMFQMGCEMLTLVWPLIKDEEVKKETHETS